MMPQQGCWLSVTCVCVLSQPPKSLWKRKHQQDLRALPLCNFLSKSGFYSPLTCSRCLSQSHIKFILYAGSSQSCTDGRTIRWWEKNKSNYSFWVWGCSSISSPASTVSISRGKKAANERKVSGSGLQRAPAAVIHSALNLNLNLNRLITHPAAQMEKPVENVCRSGIFFQESACEEKRH